LQIVGLVNVGKGGRRQIASHGIGERGGGWKRQIASQEIGEQGGRLVGLTTG